jgi:hypothetical protein
MTASGKVRTPGAAKPASDAKAAKPAKTGKARRAPARAGAEDT